MTRHASRRLGPAALLLAFGCATPAPDLEREPPVLHPRPWPPASYVCYRAPGPIAIDGRLDDAAWAAAEWTASFVDIEGDRKPRPRWKTRVKLLWDDEALYIAAELEEPNVWATLTERDSVIFHDNDFEVFLDPDGDTHRYGELELNAFGTEWDLFLERPYRDGVTARDDWDIAGLRTAVHVDGTLNDPRDLDRGWTVELALPWRGLGETRAGTTTPPAPGERWRVNFSRVQWRVDYPSAAGATGFRYERELDPATGRRRPEDNWVWSPQGAIDMHAPEMWGFVQFSPLEAGAAGTARAAREAFRVDPADDAAFALRQVYYAQRAYRARYGELAPDLAALGLSAPPASIAGWERLPPPPRMTVQAGSFEAVLVLDDGRSLRIDDKGRLVVAPPE